MTVEYGGDTVGERQLSLVVEEMVSDAYRRARQGGMSWGWLARWFARNPMPLDDADLLPEDIGALLAFFDEWAEGVEASA